MLRTCCYCDESSHADDFRVCENCGESVHGWCAAADGWTEDADGASWCHSCVAVLHAAADALRAFVDDQARKAGGA